MTKIQIKSKIFVHLAGFLSFLITKRGGKNYPKASDCSDREKQHYKSASDYSDGTKTSSNRASDCSDREKQHYKSASDCSDGTKTSSNRASD